MEHVAGAGLMRKTACLQLKASLCEAFFRLLALLASQAQALPWPNSVLLPGFPYKSMGNPLAKVYECKPPR